MPLKAIWPSSSAKAKASPCANRLVTPPNRKARLSARSSGSLLPAPSPMRHCWMNARKHWQPRSLATQSGSDSPGWISPQAALPIWNRAGARHSTRSWNGSSRQRYFELASSSRVLIDLLGTLDLIGFGADDLPLAISAAGALLQNVSDTQKAAVPHIRGLQVEERTEALILDAATRRNLELDVSMSGNPDATLFALLDQCVTAMGSRQLRRWLNRPLTDQPTLRGRYQALGALITGRNFEGIREHLKGIGDIERILARVALRSARPRDLTQLRRSLALLPALRATLEPIDSPLLQELRARIEAHDDD